MDATLLVPIGLGITVIGAALGISKEIEAMAADVYGPIPGSFCNSLGLEGIIGGSREPIITDNLCKFLALA